MRRDPRIDDRHANPATGRPRDASQRPSHAWSAPIAAVVTLISRRTGTSPDRCATSESSLSASSVRSATSSTAAPSSRLATRAPCRAASLSILRRRPTRSREPRCSRAEPSRSTRSRDSLARPAASASRPARASKAITANDWNRRDERSDVVSVIGTRINDRVDQQRGWFRCFFVGGVTPPYRARHVPRPSF